MNYVLSLCLSVLLISAVAQSNTATGTNAGNAGSDNSSFGYLAGDIITGASNTFVGSNAGVVSTTATRNTFIGFATGRFNTTGSYNTFLGNDAGYKHTTGSNNVFIGSQSGYNLTSGSNNTFLGNGAGAGNIIGTGNVFLGAGSGYNETGSNKLYIENSSSSIPLIYGDFSTNQVGINALSEGFTFNVGGTFNAAAIYVNGQPVNWGNPGTPWAANGTTIYYNLGSVGIGTSVPGSFKLAVEGKIGAREVQVTLENPFPDYVFSTNYELMPLKELKNFIAENKHLPEIPSADEVKANGHKLGEMDILLLKKIEELTLYVIELNQEIKEVKAKNEDLASKLKKCNVNPYEKH